MAVNDEKIKGVSVNYATVFFSGLVLLVSGLLIFLLVLKSIYGNFDLRDILPTKENLSYMFTKKESNIAILYSNYTENILPEGNTWVSDNVDAWENFAKSTKLYYDIITDRTIEMGEHYKYDLIVLPGARALSDREIVEIKKYIEFGGSVFATGGTASYSNEGKWRGWKFFTEVYGLNFTKEIEPEETYKIHTLRGNIPLTAGIPTGYTLQIATWDRPIFAEILEPRVTQASFWYDFRREAGLVREQIENSAGIVYGNYGEGRFVWYGFELNSVIGTQEDYINYDKLFRNSINWLTHQPIAFIRDWPPPFRAASVFIPTLDENIGNAANLRELLRTAKYPSTFFVSSENASRNSQLVSSLSSVGDFGAIVDVGYMDSAEDTVNTLFTKDVQLENINSAVQNISGITGKQINGIMPYYSFIDDNTQQAMAELQLDYFVTDSLTDRSVPKVLIRNDKSILQITKTARDDYEVVKNYGLTNPEYQAFTYREDVDRILFEGGLYVFKVHSAYQMREDYVRVIGDVLRYTRENNMWLTGIDELKQWWFKRGRIELKYSISSKVRMEVEVTNLAEETIPGFVVEVDLNKRITDLSITSDLVNTKLPDYQFNENENRLYLEVKNLEEGESRSFLVDYQNIDDSGV